MHNEFFGVVMNKNFIPNLIVKSIYDIEMDYLLSKGIKGLLLDIDDTLVPHGEPLLPQSLVDWLARLREKGFKIIFISNNNQHRVSSFAKKAGFDFVANALKPFSFGYTKAGKLINLKNNELCMVGDQIFTDIYGANRKNMHTILILPLSDRKGFFINLRRFFEKGIIEQYNLNSRG
jgi:HAD superfamily phosphatase (TIGR01668 family)